MHAQSFVRPSVLAAAAIFAITGCTSGGAQTTLLPASIGAAAAQRAPSSERMLSAVNAAPTVSMLTEQPWFADSFVNSIGVNTHFSYGPYNSQFPAVQNALVALGVLHIRDGLQFFNPFFDHLAALGKAGIHADIITGLNIPMADIAPFAAHIPGVVESFEGPNEPNDAANWVTNVRSYQHALYQTVKSTPAIAADAVLGPALAWRVSDWALLGNISSDLDYGNIHDYFGGTNPGGGDITWNTYFARAASGTKRIISTETGYCTSWGVGAVTDAVMEKYVPRMFFEQYLTGIPRTLEYELIDEDSGTYAIWNNCGLLHTDLTPKPAYFALKSVIATLADPGPWFARVPLSYSISDTSKDVHHALIQKRDGSYYLAIWLEDSGFNVPGRYATPITSRSITVTFANLPSTARYIRIGANGAAYTGDLTQHGNAISVMVADSIGILRITH
jgi:hypothetical protein